MFGFGVDKKQVAHLAGIIFGLQKEFLDGATTVALELGILMPQYGDKNLAIIYGFANAGADHMGVEDKVMMRALEEYFCSMPDGSGQMLRLMKIFTDPTYKAAAHAGFEAAKQFNTERDFKAPMRGLALKLLKDII